MSQLRIAMLGTGGIAAKHLNVFKDHPDVEVVAGCDVSEEIVEGFWNRMFEDGQPKPAVFTDTKTMYEQTKPDAVVICTPHTLHFEQAMEALEYDCHILMEKPMVTQVDHACKLAEKVEAKKKVFVVGYNTPCSPEFHYIREQIRTNALGNLELISGHLLQDWKNLTTGLWRQKPELSGGGQAYDSGAHLMCSLCWTVESPVAEVHAFVDNKGTPVDINSVINIRFENGVLASITIGGNCPSDEGYMLFAFDKGRINCDGWCASWMEIHKGHERVKYPQVTGEAQEPAVNFIDAILGRAEACTNPGHGIIHTELMDAIYESARTGQAVRPKRPE